MVVSTYSLVAVLCSSLVGHRTEAELRVGRFPCGYHLLSIEIRLVSGRATRWGLSMAMNVEQVSTGRPSENVAAMNVDQVSGRRA